MDPEDDALAPYRAAAPPLIAGNLMTLDDLARRGWAPAGAAQPYAAARPRLVRSPQPEDPNEAGRRGGAATLAGVKRGLEAAGEHLASGEGSHAVRRIAGAHIAAPGVIYDLANIATADDKARALAGAAGGRIGELALGGLAAELPPLVPVAAFAGSYLGDTLGTGIYDHGPQIVDALKHPPPEPNAAIF